MEFNSFKDAVFELLNEGEWEGLEDIDTNDRDGVFLVSFQDGSQFEVLVRKAG